MGESTYALTSTSKFECDAGAAQGLDGDGVDLVAAGVVEARGPVAIVVDDCVKPRFGHGEVANVHNARAVVADLGRRDHVRCEQERSAADPESRLAFVSRFHVCRGRIMQRQLGTISPPVRVVAVCNVHAPMQPEVDADVNGLLRRAARQARTLGVLCHEPCAASCNGADEDSPPAVAALGLGR